MDYVGVIIKPVPTTQPRDICATARYMADLENDGHKVPHDEQGAMSGSMNCISPDRAGQLLEIDNTLKLHGNLKSSQAASHQVISYPNGVTPTRTQIERDIKILLKKYGMQDHCLVWDAHTDTDNFHVHLLISRVSLTPNELGQYPIADSGLVKTKTTKERTKSGKVRVRGPRTDWAACRQAAIHEIGEAYGWPPPENLRCTKEGKPLPRQTSKDSMSDKTRVGERKTGKKSRERQISETAQKIFASSTSWRECDQIFASFAMEITFKTKGSKVVGGYITGPDNRKCSFAKCGPGCSYPALEKRFGIPSANDAACINEYYLMPFEYKDLLTPEEAKKRLVPVFRDAQSWPQLISDLQSQSMSLERSGGGLIVRFNDHHDSIKCSEISNRFSLSKLEKLLGPCPIPKAASVPTARDLLIQDAKGILDKHIRRGHGLYWMETDLDHANIQIVKKTFPNNVGERQNYWAVERGSISVPLSAVTKTPAGKPVTMWMLERLDAQDTITQKMKMLEAQRRKFEETNRRCRPGGDLHEKYMVEALRCKTERVEKVSFFAAVAQFVKLKFKNMEKEDVYPNSSSVTEERSGTGSPSFSQPMFSM